MGDLQRRCAARYINHRSGEDDVLPPVFAVRKLDMFSLADYMFVNVDTLAALQILDSESHPNRQLASSSKRNQGAKENLSLYGVFSVLARTSQGKHKLRQMLLRPSINPHTIKERQNTLAVLLRPENSEILRSMHQNLRKIPNMRNTMGWLRRGAEFHTNGSNVRHGVWGTLQQFSSAFFDIIKNFEALVGRETLEVLPRSLCNMPHQDIFLVGKLVAETIDFHQSRERQTTSIARGIDSVLDELKCRYDAMGPLLTDVASRLNEEIPQWAQEYVQSCIFLPQIGFLTIVSMDPQTGQGLYEGEGSTDPSWKPLFHAKDCVYYKNQKMKDLDEEVGDLYCTIIGK